MCHNVIDGRFHEPCQHFKAISTRCVDCLHQTCLFSNRHPVGCVLGICKCTRKMGAPILNPIRLSPNQCPDCSLTSAYPQKREDLYMTRT